MKELLRMYKESNSVLEKANIWSHMMLWTANRVLNATFSNIVHLSLSHAIYFQGVCRYTKFSRNPIKFEV